MSVDRFRFRAGRESEWRTLTYGDDASMKGARPARYDSTAAQEVEEETRLESETKAVDGVQRTTDTFAQGKLCLRCPPRTVFCQNSWQRVDVINFFQGGEVVGRLTM